jgi:hypothetical protein
MLAVPSRLARGVAGTVYSIYSCIRIYICTKVSIQAGLAMNGIFEVLGKNKK